MKFACSSAEKVKQGLFMMFGSGISSWDGTWGRLAAIADVWFSMKFVVFLFLEGFALVAFLGAMNSIFGILGFMQVARTSNN